MSGRVPQTIGLLPCYSHRHFLLSLPCYGTGDRALGAYSFATGELFADIQLTAAAVPQQTCLRCIPLRTCTWFRVADSRNEQTDPLDLPAGTSATAPKTRKRTLLQKLLKWANCQLQFTYGELTVSSKNSRNVRLTVRKDTVFLPVNVPPKPQPER